MIHSTAIIDPLAQLAANVEIGPYAIIEPHVVIHEGVKIGAHTIIHRGTTLDKNVRVGAHAMIGGMPQVYHFDESIISFTYVGSGTKINEGVTIHRAAVDGSVTTVGKNSFIMSYAHIGHDCVVHDGVTLANNVLLGGFVEVGADTNIGGGAAIHQKIRIGEGVMISGLAVVTMDVPHYVMVANRNTVYGLNLIGLKRKQVEQSTIGDLKRAYQHVLGKPGNLMAHAQHVLDLEIIKSDAGQKFLKFFLEKPDRCFVKPEYSTTIVF